MNSLVSPDDHWVIWTFLVGMAALSLFLEQKYKFVRRITGAATAVCAGMLVSNIGLLPYESPSYDVVWEYIVPLVIPLLLIKTDIRVIFKETGRFAGAFHISALGTVVGSFIAVAVLYTLIDDLELIGPAMTASYIGGSVNFVSVVSMFNPPKDLMNATLVADSGVMIIYFLFLITLAVISIKTSRFFDGPDMPAIIKLLLGQQYLVLTTFSILFPIIFPKAARKLVGNEELGTFFIFIFFVMIGLPASFKKVILEAPIMILFCAIILFINFLLTFGLGKLFKYELEELVLAAIVTSGGPMSGVAAAISKKGRNLIFPSLMLGIWGYVIGNYIGYMVGILLQAIL